MANEVVWPPNAAGVVVDFLVGGALTVLGALLMLATLVFWRQLVAWRALGFFSFTIGVVTVMQSTPLSYLLTDAVWNVQVVASILISVGLTQFTQTFFGAPSRGVRLFQLTVVAYAAVAVVLLAFGVSRHPLRQLGYVPTLISVVLATRLAWRAGKRNVVGAREFMAGLVVLTGFGLIDVLHGLGMEAVAFSGLPWGELFFVSALALMLVRRQVEQHEKLAAMAQELRHQVESRSRELRLALTSETPLTESGEHRPGELIDKRYRLVRTIGSGAMGVVYEATRETDGTRVALKTMRGQPSREDAARFAREAELAAGLRSPYLVPVLDVGLSDGSMFLVMEFIDGENLKSWPHVGNRAATLPVLRDVARGLLALHTASIAHRDLKPANVLVQGAGADRVARIADLGVARTFIERSKDPEATATRNRHDLTRTGHAVGTPRYMAPEQVSGEPTLSSDVYGFAVMALELLGAPVDFEALPWVRFERRLAATVPTVGIDDPVLTPVLQRCLALEPAQRPTAGELVAAFERAA